MGTSSGLLMVVAGFVIFLVGLIYVIQILTHPPNLPLTVVIFPALLALMGGVIIVIGVTRLGD